MKQHLMMGAVLAMAALTSFHAKAQQQECDNGLTVYFGLNQNDIEAMDKAKLDSLRKVIKEQNLNYVEIGGHADQKGSDDYNYKLAGLREKRVKSLLVNGSFPKNVEIKEYNFGESKPKYTEGDETILGKNRRVEIYFASLENGKLMLRQPTGTSVGIDKSFFSTCGLCGSFATVNEVRSEAEAKQNNISLATNDGADLTTAGMIKLHFDCDKQKDACTVAEIKIPADKVEGDVSLWEATGQGSDMKWSPRTEEVKYDAAAGAYRVNAKVCNDVWLNIGKEMPRFNTLSVKLPDLQRDRDVLAFNNEGDQPETMKVTVTADGFTTQCMDCMEFVTVNDSGVADNGFVYFYDGDLQPTLVRNDNKTSYYELTMAHYKPNINYSDSVIIVKIPKKYATRVKMYLPALDSSLTVRHYGKSEKLFRLKKPSHEYALTLTPKKNTTYRIEDEQLKVKYNARKKMYFAKLKKKDIENAPKM